MLDTFWRRVVGWSIDLSQTAALVTNALGMAIANRDPQPGVIVHSDHGVQFTSWAFTDRVKPSGLVPSMGSIGDCYDNAVIESFWGRMQTELLDGGTVISSSLAFLLGGRRGSHPPAPADPGVTISRLCRIRNRRDYAEHRIMPS